MRTLKVVIGVLFICGPLIGKGQEINQKVSITNGQEKLLGLITKEALTKDSFATWFNSQYDQYQVDEETLKPIKTKLKKYDILSFMGTWCGDSKREVPRFYKLLETMDYPMEKLTMIAVDNTRENYKKSPTGEEKGYNIIKVPTFIILENGKEINRIIESPKTSLEKDMAAIILKNAYVPNYKIVPVD